jgi:Family of unknown function (DUF6493)
MSKSEELKAILEAGDVDACLALFRGLPEKERRVLAPQCLAWHREIRKNDFIETAPNTWQGNPLGPAAHVAVFCTGTLSELVKIPRWVLPRGDRAFDILADRRPPWLEPWTRHLLDGNRYWQDWRLVRRLVREGLIKKPEHPNYILGMISGINQWTGRETTVRERLLEDPALLADEFWRLFEYEGAGENSLANVDRFSGKGWSGAIHAFIEEGSLSRERLMTCCLEALRRDFNHYRAKWFATLYDSLNPTADEQRAHAQTFLTLVGVSAPNIVSWAFKKVQTQERAGAYAAGDLIAGLLPALEMRTKGLVKSVLKLLGKTARAAPETSEAVASAAVAALTHDAADVQAAALDVIELAPHAQVATLLEGCAELVAPSLRNRVETWIGPSEYAAPLHEPEAPDLTELTPALRNLFGVDALLAQPVGNQWTLPAATFDGTELPRLVGQEPIVPVRDLDELVDLASQAIENAVGPDDFERVLDGLARLCDQRPDDFEVRTAPLLKRIEHRMKRDFTPFSAEGPASDLCGLLHAWITGGVATSSRAKNEHGYEMVTVVVAGESHRQYTANLGKTLGVLTRRSYALSRQLAVGRAGPLLSAPTHTGGLIDPVVLADRVNDWQGDEPDITEVVVALLRLAPERRSEALKRIDSGNSEWVRAVRYALGSDEELGATEALWITATRARSPWGIDERVAVAFPRARPDAGEPAVYALKFKKDKHGHVRIVFPKELKARGGGRDCVPIVLHAERGDSMWELGGIGGPTEHSVRWSASTWPIARESFFAAAVLQLAQNIDWWGAEWHNKTLLEPLLDPGIPLREMGLMLLAIGLGAKEPGEHGLATDAAIAAVEDGRLGSDNLGRVLAVLLPTGLIKPGRWAKTLRDVARASPAHAAVVKLGLQPCLAVLADPPRDFGKLFDLLNELCAELSHGVAGDVREHLKRVKGSGKTAKTAKGLLAVPVDVPSAQMQSAVNQLVDMRVRAAARWMVTR